MSERLAKVEDEVMALDVSLDPLVAIQQWTRGKEMIDWKIEQAIREARTVQRAKGFHVDHVDGESRHETEFGLASWGQIGNALGVSRQVAWRKYAHTIG